MTSRQAQPPSIAKLRVPRSRTSDGKKVDTWHIDIPERKSCEFEIRLHAERDELWFEAVTSDPGLRSLSRIRSTDIGDLRRKLSRAVSDYVESYLGEKWAPAILLEAGVYVLKSRKANDADLSEELQISLRIENVRAAPQDAGSNSLGRKVLRGVTVHEVVERGRLDEFPKGETLSESARWSNERSTPVGRSVIDGGHASREDVLKLKMALQHFGEALADRLSPSRMHEGIPSPESLRDILEDALSRMDREPSGNPGYDMS